MHKSFMTTVGYEGRMVRTLLRVSHLCDHQTEDEEFHTLAFTLKLPLAIMIALRTAGMLSE